MIRWLILLCIVIISAGILGFAETSAGTAAVVKWVYLTATILVILALLLRDLQRKEVG